MNEKKGPEFQEAAVFVSPDGTIAVRVTKRLGYRPAYSFEVCRPNKDNKTGVESFARYFQVFTASSSAGRSHITNLFDCNALLTLIMQAEGFIQIESQRRENEILDERRAKEEAEASKGKEASKGLRTLAKRDKERRGLP